MQNCKFTSLDYGRRVILQSQEDHPLLSKVTARRPVRSASFKWKDIAEMLQTSRSTLYGRVRKYNLEHLNRYSDISGDKLDELRRGYISWHGNTTGKSYLIGFLRSLGLRVQRDKIRRSLTRVDQENSALRWAYVIHITRNGVQRSRAKFTLAH